MRAAYIGILTPGSTSRMRAEWLRKLRPAWQWDWIDTDAPMIHTSRVAQSIAYRFQAGPAVDAINEIVLEEVGGRSIDVAWVDKAVFLRPRVVQALRQQSRRLVHFTPDTAFHANKSRHFNATLGMFDLLVTTKSFELDSYAARGVRSKVLLTTQGFDPTVHHPQTKNDRAYEVSFVGLAERSREQFVGKLLENGITVRLAGAGWRRFARNRKNDPLLRFEGDAVFGEAYSRLLSRCWIGLGLLSKRFPELHTTRTFEIPACGSVLATERNAETTKLFASDEALFFDAAGDLAKKISALFERRDHSGLEEMAARGRERVISDGRDYPSILSRILDDPRVH